jgi:hypothetical protein
MARELKPFWSFGMTGSRGALQARRLVTVVPVEKGSAARRESYFGIANRIGSVELNQVVDLRVFPYGMPWACGLPRLHRFGIGPAPT